MDIRTVGAIVLASLFAAPPATRANEILNGDFETGDFGDWTTVPAPADSLFFVSGNPHTGSYAAWFGAVGPVDETIWQTLPTDAGDTYQIEFWLAHGATDPENDFTAYWNGSPLMSLAHASSFPYTRYSFIETAAGGLSTLQFAGRDVVDYYYLDGVSVTYLDGGAHPVVPEPATLLLLGTGIGAAVRSRRRHSEQSA